MNKMANSMKQMKKCKWMKHNQKIFIGLMESKMFQYDNNVSFTWKSGHLEFNTWRIHQKHKGQHNLQMYEGSQSITNEF